MLRNQNTFFVSALVLFVLVFSSNNSNAFQVFNSECIKLAKHSKIIEDPCDSLTFEMIKGSYIDSLGTTLTEDIPNLDFTKSSYWVKFNAKNMSARSKDFVLEIARPLTNRADLYIERRNGSVTLKRNGDNLPFAERELKHRKLLFIVKFRPQETLTFYLNLASDGEVITLPITMYKMETLTEKDYHEQYMFGVYYGILIFVALIYSFFFFALREKSFLYYSLYIISLIFMQLSLDGLAFQYLWPYSTWIANHAVLLFSNLVIIFLLQYASKFLHLKENFIKLNLAFRIYIGLTFLNLINSCFDSPLYYISFPIANILGLLSVLLILFSIYIVQKKIGGISIFFRVAFVFFIIGALLFVLGNLNIIEPTLLTEHGVKFGSALEVIFLSLSMANRYREIQKEKEVAQAESIIILEEKNKLQDNINNKLEQQVKERTSEINKQKEELSEKNKEITDSINYAKGIQEAILPQNNFLENFVSENFVLFKPKDIVSGDFYWMDHKNNSVYFAAVDCTGHGVPGAFVSMVGANNLKRTVSEFSLSKPSDILDKLSELVEDAFKLRKDGMDISLVKVTLGENSNEQITVEWAGAYNPLWIIKNKDGQNELIDIGADRQPIGAFDFKSPFTNHTIELSKGDCIYIFTDGYPDQFGGPKGKKFRPLQLKILLLSICDKKMSEQKEILDTTLRNWMGSEHEQIDDICMIGVRL